MNPLTRIVGHRNDKRARIIHTTELYIQIEPCVPPHDHHLANKQATLLQVDLLILSQRNQYTRWKFSYR